MRPERRWRISGKTASVMQRCPEMRLHCFRVVLERHHFHWANRDDACIVDQHVYRAEAIADGTLHFVNLSFICYIAWNRGYIGTTRS